MKQPETVETLHALFQEIGTQEALGRIAKNDDFLTFLVELKGARDTIQQAYNEADLTKPIPTAEIKGQLTAINILLKGLDTTETVVRQLKQRVETVRAEIASGGGVRNPISAAIRPQGG